MTADLREALTTALRAEGFVRGVAGRYGKFNDTYWEQSADAVIAALPPGTALITDAERADRLDALSKYDVIHIHRDDDEWFVTAESWSSGVMPYRESHEGKGSTIHAAVDALLEAER